MWALVFIVVALSTVAALSLLQPRPITSYLPDKVDLDDDSSDDSGARGVPVSDLIDRRQPSEPGQPIRPGGNADSKDVLTDAQRQYLKRMQTYQEVAVVSRTAITVANALKAIAVLLFV
jgi:hypothetical protein